MKMLFKIFKRDLLKIKRNYAAMIIVIGLCFIPSLYAWINIAACWDPYANTGNLPVAVINKDDGAIINSTEVNVGAQVVENLKKNKSIKWEVLDEWQANNALNEGSYYAIIEIPQNFSSGLVSLTTSNPKKPSIVYKANEKANAIATKITNVAKDKLTKEIKLNFVKTVNEKAFDELNKVGLHLDKTKPKVLGIKDVVNTADGDLGKIKNYINSSSKDAEELSKYISSVKNDLPLIKDQINNLQKATEASKNLVNNTKNNLNTMNSDINTDIMQLQLLSQKVDGVLNDIKGQTSPQTAMLNEIDQAIGYINQMKTLISNASKTLKEINNVANNEGLKVVLDSFDKLEPVLDSELTTLQELRKQVSNGQFDEKYKSTVDSLIKINDELTSKIVSLSSDFYKNGTNAINNIANTTNTSLTQLNSILETTKMILPQLDALANYGIASSNQTVKDANELNTKISTLQKGIQDLGDKLKDLNENNLNKIIDIMEKNPNEVANFLTSPIEVKEVEVYGKGIFGIGLTPFYTVLAIWVGSLLSAALLTTACEDFEEGKQPNMLQRHFGKMLLFISITIIQAVIVTLGDWLILGIDVYNVPLLFGFAILTAITFTIIIFTLVSLMGNVGKAIAVVIMVFQIAGAGGIYPIQTNPEVFGVLYPLWPFTYAINGFREAIAGPVWKTVDTSVVVLLVYCVIFIILSILKKPLHKITHFMEHMFEKAEL
ncbi:putative membrane protein [Clostridium cavendishii DSM 21758]|uniref:Putative membrane protein n=1 Tax=Clostridium cavendishii DSM 21758 TaxID=1121302 RepID=A0A1M6GAF1_9CLOT|nr:YhgE/Pip domain-containing protein [Clostridium cavendishii]SHJ06916.1 putative membrane protein [Clostridium cavendishii DSM 21758]